MRNRAYICAVKQIIGSSSLFAVGCPVRNIKLNMITRARKKHRKRFSENYECYETLILVTAGATQNLRDQNVDIKMTNHDGRPNVFASLTDKPNEKYGTNKFARLVSTIKIIVRYIRYITRTKYVTRSETANRQMIIKLIQQHL